MKERPLEDSLQSALERLEQGASLEEVLTAFPAQQAELRPLLIAALQVQRSAAAVTVPRRAASRSRAQFLAESARLGPRRPILSWTLQVVRYAALAVLLVAIVLAGFLGSGIVSAEALPGDTLYPVKLAVEKIRLQLAGDSPARLVLEEQYDDRRLDEVERLNQIQRKEEVNFTGVLLSPNGTDWQVGSLRLVFKAGFPVPANLAGKYVQVTGLSDHEVVEVISISLRLYQWDGLLQAMDANLWTVGGVEVGLDEATQTQGSSPRLGAPVAVTAIRLADERYLAITLQVSAAASPTPPLARPTARPVTQLPTEENHERSGEASATPGIKSSPTMQQPSPSAVRPSTTPKPTETKEPENRESERSRTPAPTLKPAEKSPTPKLEKTPTGAAPTKDND